jgi:multisubunit Na+/H+ antiporter MnhE subunit
MRRAGVWLAWAVPLWGVWLVMNLSSLSRAELVVGGGCAALSALVAVGLHEQGLLRLSPKASWLRFTGRLVWRTLVDTGTVLAEVVRRLGGGTPRGGFVTYSFPAHGRDARSVARKVLATTALSLPPNSYVVDFDEETNRMLVHELVSKPRQGDDWRQLL